MGSNYAGLIKPLIRKMVTENIRPSSRRAIYRSVIECLFADDWGDHRDCRGIDTKFDAVLDAVMDERVQH